MKAVYGSELGQKVFQDIVDATGVESDSEQENYTITTSSTLPPTTTPIGGIVVGRVFIVKSELTTELDNLVPVTVEDNQGNPILDGTQVTLRVTSDGFDKSYVGTTSGGIATLTIPKTDLERGKTYTLVATAGGINSDPIVINIPLLLRSSPTSQPSSGPAETMTIVLLFLAGGLTYYWNKKREEVRW